MNTFQQFLENEISNFKKQLTECIKATIKQQIKEVLDEKDDLLSPEEARKIFSPPISRSSLHTYTMSGKLQKYFIGRKTFYSRKEIVQAITGIKGFNTTSNSILKQS